MVLKNIFRHLITYYEALPSPHCKIETKVLHYIPALFLKTTKKNIRNCHSFQKFLALLLVPYLSFLKTNVELLLPNPNEFISAILRFFSTTAPLIISISHNGSGSS